MCAAFVLALLVLALLDPHRPIPGITVLDRAEEAVFVAPDGTVLWQPENVRLSQNWNTDAAFAVRSAREPTSARYRLRFEADEPHAAMSIMIARVSQAVRIGINGREIHDDHDAGALKHWDWYAPVTAEVPDGLIRPGSNTLTLGVLAAPNSVAGLSRVFIGERKAVERMSARLFFLQRTLPTYANVSIVVLSIPLFLIWLHGRDVAGRPFRVYGLLAAASVLFALRSMHVHAGEPAMPHHLWIVLVGASMGWALGFLFSFMLHYVDAGSRRVDRAMALLVAAGTLLLPFVPGERFVEYVTLFWYVPLAIAGAVCAVVLCVQTVRAPDVGRIGLSLSLLLLLAAGIHDVLWTRGLVPFESLLWMPLVMPAVLFAISAAVANRFVLAWVSADALNRDLAARVRAAESEIAASWEWRLEAERRETLAAERAKLVEDLHDGVGSRLSMLLATLHTAALSPQRVSEVLRDCLDDLRMVITARDHGSLGEALAELCGQLDSLVTAHGAELDPEIGPDAGALRLGARETLNLLRFVQEACANAARYGRGDRIRLKCGFAGPDVLRIVVKDRGTIRSTARPAPRFSSGRGVTTMQARAARMGGRLTVDRRPEGWRVVLDIPLSSIRMLAP